METGIKLISFLSRKLSHNKLPDTIRRFHCRPEQQRSIRTQVYCCLQDIRSIIWRQFKRFLNSVTPVFKRLRAE